MDDPDWCDPALCTAAERIPDRPPAWFAHRSKPASVPADGGHIVLQLVQPAGADQPRLAVGVKPDRVGGLSLPVALDHLPGLAAAVEELSGRTRGR